MSNTLKIALAQLNLTVGDLQQNVEKIMKAALDARDQLGAELIVFPELSLTGYPPEDLLYREDFLKAVEAALNTLKNEVKNISLLIGLPLKQNHALYNACVLIEEGTIQSIYHKQRLPNYGVFDEARYFSAGNQALVTKIKDISVGFLICEDLWHKETVERTIQQGAKILVVLNASPFEVHKNEARASLLKSYAQQFNIPFIYVNCVGGQDELIFDGGSMAVNAEGDIVYHAEFFKEKIDVIEIETSSQVILKLPPYQLTESLIEERIYQALMLGLKDYVEKNKFKSVVLGLSGGIDSALVALIAHDALSAARVHAIIMPSRYTAEMSVIDAKTLSDRLKISCDIVSIEAVFQSFLDTLSPILANNPPDITEENLQARIRANILMAYSNKFGHLVLSTSNRSELAMGYGTLYGDMAGGFNVLKDIPKTLVYRLAKYRNSVASVIPPRIIERPPSAELAYDQKDEDTLPPYAELDQILALYIEKEWGIPQICKAGFSEETVRRVVYAIWRNEYKRRQSPPGVRINHKAFGRDRRYPITCGNPELEIKKA